MKPRHLAYILFLLPVFIVRDYQPSHELKYLSIVDEALDNNTWFAFYNHGEAYADKPPLFFWWMMLCKMLVGKHLLWLIGLFSLLPAAGVMAVMDRWFERAKIPHDPLASNLMLGTCVMFLGAAAILRMDMLMLFFIVLASYTFNKMYCGWDRPYDRWLLPVWIFLAVFSKGPVGFLVPVLSIFVFLAVKLDLRSVGKYLGWRQWTVMLGLCAAWFGMVYMEGGAQYLDNLLVKQTVGRGVDAYHHKEPVWFYLAHILWMAAPWTLLFVASIWVGMKKKLLRNDACTFLLCIICTTAVMLTAFSSKVQIYMLPVFPFVAYLSSAYIFRQGNNKLIRAAAAIPAAVLALAFPASFFAGRFISYQYQTLLPFHIATFLLSAGAVFSLWLLLRGMAARGVAALSFSLLLCVAVSAFGLPQFNEYLGFGTMARGGMETARQYGTENYAYFSFYRGQNMDVYTGHKMHTIETVSQVDSLIRNDEPTVMFMLGKELGRVDGLREVLEGQQVAGTAYKYQWYVLGGNKRETQEE